MKNYRVQFIDSAGILSIVALAEGETPLDAIEAANEQWATEPHAGERYLVSELYEGFRMRYELEPVGTPELRATRVER